jgi:hypothetical protein
MADTKISALTGVTTVAGTNEFAVNESGTSKKCSATQLQDFIGVKTKRVGTTVTSTSATLAKVTDLDLALAVGSWHFKHVLRVRSSSLTCAFALNASFSGTQTAFQYWWQWCDVSSTAATGGVEGSDSTTGQVRGMYASRQARTTAAFGVTISVDTVDADIMLIMEGMVEVSVAGNLELYFGSEVGADGTQSLMVGSGVIATKMG